jgi:hypothetical protein
MRTSLLFCLIAGLALFSAACTGPEPQYRTDATVKDIMDSVVDPNADYLWDSVSTDSTIKGVIEKAPKTDEDWKEVRRHAVSLMEAMNMLQIPGRPVARPGEKASDPRVEEPPEVIKTMIDSDRGSWTKYANGLYDATALVLKAVEAKNTDGILDAGDRIDQACESCHLKYWYPKQTQLLEELKKSGSVRPSK